MTNAWLLSHGERHILIDAPEDVAAWVQSLGVRLDALFLTHQHFDHVQGAAEIQAAHQCPVYAFAAPSPQLWMSAFFRIDIEPFTVDHVLENHDSLSLLGEDFTLLYVPGHSPDSLCLYHPPSGLCACGDTILPGSHGRTDFPGGSERQLFAGIAQHLYSLPDHTLLLPGHGDEVRLIEEKQTNRALRHLVK